MRNIDSVFFFYFKFRTKMRNYSIMNVKVVQVKFIDWIESKLFLFSMKIHSMKIIFFLLVNVFTIEFIHLTSSENAFIQIMTEILFSAPDLRNFIEWLWIAKYYFRLAWKRILKTEKSSNIYSKWKLKFTLILWIFS